MTAIAVHQPVTFSGSHSCKACPSPKAYTQFQDLTSCERKRAKSMKTHHRELQCFQHTSALRLLECAKTLFSRRAEVSTSPTASVTAPGGFTMTFMLDTSGAHSGDHCWNLGKDLYPSCGQT
eukprot:6189064-Amphidinium_carterae.1